MKLELVSCVNCGSNSSNSLFQKFDLTIAKCECGLVFVNPRLPEADSLNRYNDDYFLNEYLPSLGITDNNYDLTFFDKRYAAILELIQEKAGVANNGKLLEIGFGAGFFLKSAERAGWEVSGTEASLPCYRFARDELSLKVRFEKAEEATFNANTFDVAVMFDVIEHVFNPFRVLSSICNVLKDGGLLVVVTPNFNAVSRIMLGLDWSVISPVDHLYYFTESTLNSLLNRSGFAGNVFMRTVPHGGAPEAMNPKNTHVPDSYRAKFYSFLVDRFGSGLYKKILRRGWGDLLYCFAYTRKESDVLANTEQPVLDR